MIKLNMDRPLAIALGAVAASAILLSATIIWSGAASARLTELRRAHDEMSRVSGELMTLRAKVEAMERKTAASAGKGLLSFIGQISESIGIKEKLVSQKSIPSASPWEEKAGLSFEKISLDEAANLFYRIDAQPVLLRISRVSMAPSFDEPGLLMLDITISLVKPKNEK